MGKLIVLISVGLVLVMGSHAYASDVYTETMVSHELIGGGTAMGWYGDDSAWQYTFPFPFPFYGVNYSSAYICSNGFVKFGESSNSLNNNDDSLKHWIMLAPLWDDLMVTMGQGDIYIHQPTADSVCIRWQAVQYRTNSPTEFELVLFRNGDIKFNYGITSSTLTPTIGISKGDGVHFLLSAKNNSASLSNTQSLLFRPQATGNQPPTANISANSTTGAAPFVVQFTGSGTDTDGTIASYQWNFGDGSNSTQQSPAHTYISVGNYTATLTVTDNGGATGSANTSIIVTQTVPVGLPKLMRFQGKLGDAGGVARSGSFNVIFKLYDIATDGTALWQEAQTVAVTDGVFDVELGSVTALELPFDKQYWLGIQVGSDSEMTPRFKLTTAPYSFSSKALH